MYKRYLNIEKMKNRSVIFHYKLVGKHTKIFSFFFKSNKYQMLFLSVGIPLVN